MNSQNESTGAGLPESDIVRAFLARLGRRNALAFLQNEGLDRVRILRCIEGSLEVLGEFNSSCLTAAQRQGWVIKQSDGSWRISEAGRLVARRKSKTQHVRILKTGERTQPAKLSKYNASESPLYWLRQRKDKLGNPLISQAEFEAGERLRSDFTRAHMTPRVTANYSAAASLHSGRRGMPAGAAAISEAASASAERVRRALAEVGPEMSGILLDVCCYLKGLEQTEHDAQWPQRTGKVVLQLALRALARHYGISDTNRSQQMA